MTAADAAAPLTVCIDFKSPKAYLAKDPTRALEDELALDFDWQPLLVPPLTRPIPARTDDDRGTQHRRLRAEYHERDFRRYAAHAGLPMGDLYRTTDSAVAGIGLLWCNAQSRPIARRYTDAVFAGYWADQLDIADAAAIGTVLRRVGAETAGWDEYVTARGRALLADVQRDLKDAGVFDVPGYLIDGDVFLGRHHLPMIRWILSGKVGTPPL